MRTLSTEGNNGCILFELRIKVPIALNITVLILTQVFFYLIEYIKINNSVREMDVW